MSDLALKVVVGAALASGFKPAIGSARDSILQVGQALRTARQQAGHIRTYEDLQTDLAKARVKLQDTQQAAMKLKLALKADPENEGLQRQLDRTTRRADKLSQAVEKQRDKLRAAGATLRNTGIDTSDLAAAETRLTGQIERQSRAWKRQASLMSERTRVGEAMRSNAVKLGATLATATVVAMPFIGWTRDAAGFDSEMQMIGNTADLTTGQIRALKRAIFDASKATGQSVQSVQQGIGFLVAAGLDVGRAQRSIVSIGRTATAEGANIEDLSKASFTLLDSLNIKPEGLADALDILTQSGKEGNVELRDMAAQLPVLGASFRGLKMTGRDTVATLGAALEIARKGAGDPAEAANNMRNFLSKVLAPATLAKAKGFGVDLYKIITDAQKSGGNPFEASVQAIMKATDGDAKKLGEMFNDMQVQNFLRPLMQNWSEYQRIKAKALDAHGVVDRDFAKIAVTDEQRLAEIGQAWGRFKTSIGSALGGAFGQLGAVLKPVLNGLTKLSDAHPRLIGYVGLLTGALVGLRVAMLAGKLAGGGLRMMLLGAQVAAAGAGADVAGAAKGVGLLGRTFGLLGAVISPVGLIVGAVVAVLVVGALLVRKYWEPIKAFFVGMARGIGQALAPLKPLWDAVAGSIGSVWRWVTQLVEPFHATQDQLASATSAGETFGRIVGYAIQAITLPIRMTSKAFTWLGTSIGTVCGWIAVHVGKAADAVSGRWNGSIAFVGSLWDGLKAKVGAVVDWVVGKIDWIVKKWDAVKHTVGGVWQKITGHDETDAPPKPKVVWAFGDGGTPPARNPPRGVGTARPAAAKPVVGARHAAAPKRRAWAFNDGAVPPARRAAAAAMLAATVATTPAPAPAAPPPVIVQGGDTSTYGDIIVHAAPGMDERALAKEVRRQLDERDRQNAARHRSKLGDMD